VIYKQELIINKQLMKLIKLIIFIAFFFCTISIQKINAQCAAGFTSNATLVNGQYGTGLVQFTDTSQASVGDTLISWAWNFGDGVTANIKNPIHFYPTPGNYTITLLVQDNSSSNSTQQQLLMNPAYPQGCQAVINFAYPQPYPTVPGPPVPITFDGIYSTLPTNDGIASVLWNFGDGTTSTQLSPVHTFSNDTSYTVSYTINTINGCTSNQTVLVNSAPCTMVATASASATDSTVFNLEILNGVPPYTINWQQATSPWNWEPVPSSQLSNGNLTLQALDSTVYSYGQIYAANGCPLGGHSPFGLNGFTFNFNYDQTINTNFVFLQEGGNSLTVFFADNSYYTPYYNAPINIVSHFWDFGDGTTSTDASPTHVYANYGSYTITHTITDAQGLVGTITSNINISLCNYTFTSSITPPTGNNHILIANATGGFPPYNYTWNDTLNGANPTTTNTIDANHAAYYSVRITDSFGCVASINEWVAQDAQIQYSPHFQDTCNANFMYGIGTTSALPGTNNALFTIAEEQNWGYLSVPHTYTWTYSDGYVDTLNLDYGNSTFYIRPYAQGQIFDVTLTVTGGGCNLSTTQTVDYTEGACNLSPGWPWTTSMNLFQGQYPLRINANAANGAGTWASVTYLWDNGSTAPFIYAYTSGEYCVTITDSLGCSKNLCYTYYAPYDSTITLCGNVFNDANNNGVFDGTETAVVNSNVVSIVGNGNTYNATVDGNGHYSAQVPAGIYTISYSIPAAHSFTIPASSDTIARYLNVTASLGLNQCGYNFGVSNNTSTIGGKLFFDGNTNGVLDSLEVGIAYQPITAGPYTVFTDANGNFSMNVIANNYNLTYIPQNAFSSYTLTTPGVIAIDANTVGSSFTNKNFGIHTNSVGSDLGVYLWPTSDVNNGFPAHYTIEYYNNGITSANNTITMVYDTSLNFVSSTVPYLTHNPATNTITWFIPTIENYSNNYLYVNFVSDVTLTMNTPVTCQASIFNATLSDINLQNNTVTLNQLSVSSFDPNDKLVARTNNENNSLQLISSLNPDQELEYVIRFQNIGNASAVNVVIVDEMSNLLDEDSYMLLGGSHNCEVTRLENVVTYRFNNIMLPCEEDAGDASNGFVTFRISSLSGLDVGELISDQARIYFDFNAPIITNFANILMHEPSIVSDTQYHAIVSHALGMYPNPIKEKGYVKFVLEEETNILITTTDLSGKEVFKETRIGNSGVNYLEIDATELEAGVYILKITGKNTNIIHKISISKS
jgi:PKD repeat protein